MQIVYKIYFKELKLESEYYEKMNCGFSLYDIFFSRDERCIILEKKKITNLSVFRALITLFNEIMNASINAYNQVSYLSQLGIIFGSFGLCFFIIIFFTLIKRFHL